MDLNKIMLIGRLTREPEFRTTQSGQNIATFGLATNRRWTNAQGAPQEEVEFHNIVTWGKLADIVQRYLQKGRRVFIEGRIATRSWEGQDGQKRTRTEVVASNMIMLDQGGGERTATSGASSETTPPSAEKPSQGNSGEPPAAQPVTTPPQEEEINIDDIPF